MRPYRQRYDADDRELLLGFYQKYLFRPVFSLLPEWVPPNAISVFGVLCAVCGVIAAYAATHGAPIFYLVCAALFYVYLVADNIDGSQARRLGQANELGELIDHGLDGITSGSLLVAAGIILHMAPNWFFGLSAIGAFVYILYMWEQYRTGKLVIPRISCTESVTLIALVCMVAFFGHDPVWLRFDTVSFAFNVASVILIVIMCAYLAAIFPPCVRVIRAGEALAPLWTIVFVIGGCSLYLVGGAGGLLPAIVVTMFGARVSIRLIVYRQTGVEGHPTVPSDWLILLPLIPLFLLPNVWSANIWAGIAAFIASVLCRQLLVSNIARVRQSLLARQAA